MYASVTLPTWLLAADIELITYSARSMLVCLLSTVTQLLHEVRIKLMDRMAQRAQAMWRGYRVRKDILAMSEVQFDASKS